MAKWNVGTECGILRKKTNTDNHDELLVFGYACKLFRDDEKAQYIDQGKHLIPWMGNDILKIDRYDCRGALSELLQYEASRQDYDASRWLGLSESERRIEVLCDDERYYSLKHNDEELEIYKEEELKRRHQKGSEIQYNYDVPTNPEKKDEEETLQISKEQEDQPFDVPVELNVPEDVAVPKTMKENTRIEKTVLFVNKQGLQMEILIKTKQADNPQFSFMNKDDPLHAYYKHLLAAVKNGYKVQSASENEDEKADETTEVDEHNEHYLHPSLFATSLQSAPLPVPTVVYKPSADCAYSQLVNRIQGTQTDTSAPPLPPPTSTQVQNSDFSQMQLSYEQQQYYQQQYYYAAQYYDYYKQMAQQYQQTDKLPDPSQFYGTDQNSMSIPSQMDVQNFMQNQAAYLQYLQQQSSPSSTTTTNNPYAQIVSNLSQSKDAVGYAGFAQTDDQLLIPSGEITKAAILYNRDESQSVEATTLPKIVETNPPLPPQSSTPEPTTKPKDDSVIKKPLLSLAEYGSDSENDDNDDCEKDDDNEEVPVKIPPDETQQIIDKMASYVLKNGKDFESIVKSKGDRRFDFLNDDHEFHPYYLFKMNAPSEKKTTIKDIQRNGTKSRDKKIITPVSFSIKKPKEEMTKEIKSALPIEESDEDPEEVAEESIATTTSSPIVASTTLVNTFISSLAFSPTMVPAKICVSLTPPPKDPPSSISNNNNNAEQQIDETPPIENPKVEESILEMIDLTDDLEERRQTRRAEDRRKDKIVAAAREKLALQLERKKKAAAFLKLKSAAKSSDEKSETINSNSSTTESTKPSRQIKTEKSKDDEEVAEILKVDDSESEEGEIKKHKKSSKKRKSHKRKRSRSRHEVKSRHKNKEHKKSKKRRRRSKSCNSHSSIVSQ